MAIKKETDESNTIEAQLFAVDFENGTIEIALPADVMKKGFHAGWVKVDLTAVQS